MERVTHKMDEAKLHLEKCLNISEDSITSLRTKTMMKLSYYKPLRRKKWLIVAVAICSMLMAVPVMAKTITGYLYMGNNGLQGVEGGYVVHSGYYYVKTDEIVKADMIGEQIGTVKRIGDWVIKREGDSNEFAPESGMFAIKGVTPNEKLAIKINRSSRRIDPKDAIYEYQVVRRSTPVKQAEKSKIMGSKNDPEEVSAVIKNIREVNPYLFEFKGLDKRVNLISAMYADEGVTDSLLQGTYLIYRLPEADYKQFDKYDVQGYLDVSEYSKQMINDGQIKKDSIFLQDHKEWRVLEEFNLNELHWKHSVNLHDREVYVGEKGDHIYEIGVPQNLTSQQIKELLGHFVSSGSGESSSN